MEHSKGEWKIVHREKDYVSIYCGEYSVAGICVVDSNGEADAERICKCVNGWDELEKKYDLLLEKAALLEISNKTFRLGEECLQEQRDALLTVIKRTEWVAMDNIAKLRCPICMNSADNGHRHDCELKKAIAEAEK